MSNERLRAAMDKAGVTADQLAHQVGVDVKTVYRWTGGRTPRKTYRGRIAETLKTTDADLWPEAELRVDGRDQGAEILAAYSHTNDHAAPDWRPLLARANHHVDLLDLTLSDFLRQDHATDLLLEKARSDCQVRLLLSAPESIHLTLADVELGQDLTLVDIPESAREADRNLTALGPIISAGAQTRTFIAARPNTILRFDDEMLISVHLYATPTERAPLIHLKQQSDHGLFQAFADHYELLWQDAQPL